MDELVSIHDAARALRVSPTRVRAMVAQGRLPAAKIGDRWIVERSAIDERLRVGSASGRPYSPVGAWALLLLASGEPVGGISSQQRSRFRRALVLEGLEKLAARLAKRADIRTLSVHPGEAAYTLSDPRLVKSGISAASAHGLDMVSGAEVDGYLSADQFGGFVEDHALSPAGASGNVKLRLVAPDAWPFIDGRDIAPLAAVALDLTQSADPRLARAGRNRLKQLGVQRIARTEG